MEFRRPQEDTTPTPSSLPYNPPPIRASAFSKPLLPPTASLLTPIPSPKPNGLNPTPPDPIPDPISSTSPKYRECLRNHAATLGGHVLDGCGEFMPDLTNPLQCAACSCHRSFHRKETEQQDHNNNYYTHNPRNPIPRLLLPPPLHTPYNLLTPSGSGGATTESSSEENRPGTGAAPAATATAAPPGTAARKRFRSKFTTEQKKRMMAFAESVGWRFQKQDEAAVEQFCAEVGVRRQVFKVWMHNNKHIIRRQQQELMHLQDQPQQPEQHQQELKQ